LGLGQIHCKQQNSTVGYCVHNKEVLGSVQGEEVPAKQNDCELLKMNEEFSVPCSQLNNQLIPVLHWAMHIETNLNPTVCQELTLLTSSGKCFSLN
jgi:hypothetical protein